MEQNRAEVVREILDEIVSRKIRRIWESLEINGDGKSRANTDHVE